MYTIRPASVHDIPLIRKLTAVIWPHTYSAILSEAQLAYMLDMMYAPEVLRSQIEGQAKFILCYNDEAPIGFAAYESAQNNTFKLQKIYILPEYQGKGAGKFIISYVLTDIAGKNAKALVLNVNRYNVAAQAFYKKLGFVIDEVVDVNIGNGYFMNDYVLKLDLNS